MAETAGTARQTGQNGETMRYGSLEQFLSDGKSALARGPIALIFAEDGTEIDTTLRHHQQLGFKSVIGFMAPNIELPRDLRRSVHRVDYDMLAENALTDAVNQVIKAAPGLWFYVGYNAEFLFYPFCETRAVGEMLTFNTEERRDTVLSYVIDLYAGDLDIHPNAVSLDDAHMDKSGYYALARPDPDNHGHPKERQLDFFGGLRWRYEEHVPLKSRKIDRVALFKSAPGLTMRPDFTFSDEEYNTYACPWHNNLTASVCSFRTAKALKRNPGSTFDIHNFRWHNSTRFEWHSRQLLDLGLMEPGQWF